jgi:nucleoside-diphosphate-sugar epimerase
MEAGSEGEFSPEHSRATRLIVGCGYLGIHVGRLWRAQGDTVIATTRRSRSAELEAAGLEPLVFDMTCHPLPPLPPVDTVVFAAAPDRAAGATALDIHGQGLATVLEALPRSVRAFIYVSSTGVYGQNDGSWVDETSQTHPTREGGLACLAGEALVLGHATGVRRTVVRLAGVYGSGRLPHARAVRAGVATPGSPAAYVNLIHVEDAAMSIAAVAAADGVANRYVVSDGHPLTRGEYVSRLAERLGAHDPGCLGGTGLGKRVCNGRLMREIGVTLRHPQFTPAEHA